MLKSLADAIIGAFQARDFLLDDLELFTEDVADFPETGGWVCSQLQEARLGFGGDVLYRQEEAFVGERGHPEV